jgi:hypothetical protein
MQQNIEAVRGKFFRLTVQELLLPPNAIQLESAGGEVSLVNMGLVIKGLTAGTGIALDASNPHEIIINATDALAITLGSTGAGESLVSASTGPALATKSIVAGSNVSLVATSDDVTINAADAPAITLGSTGAGESLVSAGTGPALATKSIVAGTNVTLTPTANDVTITSVTTTLADDAAATTGAGTASIVTAPSPISSDLRVRRITQSTGITITQSGANVQVSNSTTLASAGGTSIVVSGNAPAYSIKGVSESGFLEDVSTSTSVILDNRWIRVSDSSGGVPPKTGSAASATGANAVAIGSSAVASGNGSVQIGSGTNSTDNRFRFRTLFHIDSNEFYLSNLRTSDPGAGSKQFWVDTSILGANAVRYRP